MHKYSKSNTVLTVRIEGLNLGLKKVTKQIYILKKFSYSKLCSKIYLILISIRYFAFVYFEDKKNNWIAVNKKTISIL